LGLGTLALIVLLVLPACVPESEHPLPIYEESELDQRLIGTWVGQIEDDKTHIHFTPKDQSPSTLRLSCDEIPNGMTSPSRPIFEASQI